MKSKIISALDLKINFQSIKHISMFSGGALLAQGIMMVYAIIIARFLGPEQLGVYSGLYAILGVSITFVNFGLDQWALKEAHNFSSERLIIGKVISIKLFFGTFWAAFCLLIIPITRPNYFVPLLVLFASSDVLCDVLFNSIITAWAIQREVKTINIMLLSSRGGKFLLLLTLIALDMVSPITIVISKLIISLLILIISLVLFKPIVQFKINQEFLHVVRRSTEFALSEILAMIYANIDVAILTFFSIIETGLYSPASGIIHALYIIPNSLFVYLIPQYAKQFETKNDFSLRKISYIVVLIFSLIGFTLSIGLLVSGELIVTFFLDNRFMATSSVIRILSPIMLFKSMAFGFALLIVIAGKQSKRLLPQLLVVCVNISLNILLIPRFGLIGVAWVYTLSELVLMIAYFLIARNIIKNEKPQKA